MNSFPVFFSRQSFKDIKDALRKKAKVQGAWVIRPPAPGPHIRSSAPGPIKALTSPNYSYVKSSHYDHLHITFYFQRLTGYLNHVVLFMSRVHVLKKLPYLLMCT